MQPFRHIKQMGLALLLALLPWLAPAANSNLELTGRLSRSTVTANEFVTCTFGITNLGPGSAASAVLTNWLPAGALPFSISTSQGSYSTNAGSIRFALGTLNSGAGAAVQITFCPTNAGSLTNRAWTGSASNDPQPGNNGATNILNVLSAKCLPAGQLQIPRWGHTATLLTNGLVLVTGGRNAAGSVATIELFDPATGASTVAGTMLTPRYLHTATRLGNGKVLIAGHSFEDGMRLWTELYDPVAGTLTQTGDMNVARTRHAASLLADGRVLVTGGIPADTSSAETYDPLTGTWTSLPQIPASLYMHTSTLLTNGQVLLVGGWGIPTVPATLFNPVSNSFAWTGNHIVCREGHTATLLADGRVVVIGGGYGSQYPAAHSSAEIYDPATGQFTLTSPMVDARYAHTAAWLANQTLLIAGGTMNQSPATTEIYDPVTGQFTPAAPLLTPRRNHTATALPDGRILLLGGEDGQGQVHASAEIYDPARVNPPPSLIVEHASHSESEAVAAGGFQFPVRLSAPVGVPVTLNFSLRAGTSWYYEDFEPTNGVLLIPPGTTNALLSVAVLDDNRFEAGETILLTVSNAANAVLTRTEVTGTILNDDPLPVASVLPAAAFESNLLTSTLAFPVVLSNPSAFPVDVLYATTDGTATAGGDYFATNGFITFPAGVTTQAVVVILRGDIAVEPDETLQLLLSAPTNATVGASGTGTILNDDGLPGKVHHFDFSALASPQYHSQPFSLSVTARDLAWTSVSNFNGPVWLRPLSDCTPLYLFDMEQDAATNWAGTNFTYIYASFDLTPYDVTGLGHRSTALRIIPSWGYGGGVSRPVELQGGVTYGIRFDAVQVHGGTFWDEHRFDYSLRIGNTLVAQLLLDQLGPLLPGQSDRRTLSGTFTPPTNGVYPLAIFLNTSWPAPQSSVYLDNLRIEPPSLTPSVVTFTNGLWSGAVQLAGTCSNLVLEARDLETHTGQSSPFVLLPSAEVSVGTGVTPLGYPSDHTFNTHEVVTLTPQVWNAGPSDVSNIVLTNVLPPDFTFISATAPGGQVTNTGNLVISTWSYLPPGLSVYAIIQGRIAGEGPSTNLTFVSINEHDPNPANNTFLGIIDVRPPELRIESTTVTESPGGTNASFTVWLATSNNVSVTVDFATTNLGAVAGADYQAATGTVTFPPGVTNQTINVPILDNFVNESNEVFGVRLSNPSHALPLITNATATIVDNDAPPAATILDASMFEGDSGVTQFVFNVALSAPSEQWATVGYAAAPGTAQANSDYLPTSPGSYLSFAPGQTNQTITISVRGNTVNEPDETFLVNLTPGQTATIADAQAVGTILNDDAVPGRLDHFVFDPVQPNRRVNVPFAIRVQAVDAFDVAVSDFNGSVSITAPVADNPGTGFVSPMVLGNFNQGVWIGEVAVNQAWPGITLRVDDGAEHVGLSAPFNTFPIWPLTLTLLAATNETAGLITNAGTLTTLYTNDTDIELFVTSGNTNLLLAGTAILPAGQTNATFNLTVLDDALLNATRTVGISATGPGFATNSTSLKIHDNEVATLTVMMSKPGPVAEGVGSVQFQLGIWPPPDTSYQVFLTSSDTTELTVPSNIGFSAGSTSAIFNVTIINDTLIDGPQPVTVTAHVENWVDGVAALNVLDNESPNLALVTQWQGPYTEGMGTITSFRRVQLSGTLPTNLVVQLASSDPTELTVPATVTILAGQTFTNFSATFPDDDEFDGTQNVNLIATTPGFGPATNVIPVADNDPHHLVFTSGITSSRTSAVPFQINLSVRDINDVTLLHYGSLSLSAVAGNHTLPLTPAGGTFSRGLWSGNVTVHSWGTNVQLRATATNGTTSLSAPFTVVPPPWSGPPAIMTQDGYFGPGDGRFGFHIRADDGAVVVVEASTNLLAWAPVHTNVLGTWELFFFDDLEAGQFPRRFYRARLHEGPLPPPSLHDAALATGPGSLFGFNLTGVAGQGVIVEASSNLLDWAPLQTNTLGAGPLYFSDPESLQSPQRFYRLRVK